MPPGIGLRRLRLSTSGIHLFAGRMAHLPVVRDASPTTVPNVSPPGVPCAARADAMRDDTREGDPPDKKGAGATPRRRDYTTFRVRPKYRTLPKKRLTVYEPSS